MTGVMYNSSAIDSEVLFYIVDNLASHIILEINSLGVCLPCHIASSDHLYCFIDLAVNNENGPHIENQCVFVLQLK